MEEPVAELQEVVQAALSELGAPGAAVAIVHGAARFSGGYGLAEATEGLPVTSDTAFAVGSCSKSMTATLAAVLVDRGLINWEDRATRHLPELRLYDDWVTAHVTVRDLLANRVGLSRDTLYEYGSCLTAEDVVAGAWRVPPVAPFRSRFAYSNVGFVIASAVLARAGGAPFPELLRSALLAPAGMRDAATDHASALALPVLASPHVPSGDTFAPIPRLDRDNGMGSGTVCASAADLGRWLALNLAGGTIDGRRVVDAAALSEVHAPHVVTQPDDELRFAGQPAPVLSAYGLGWNLQEHLGHRLLWHDGSVDGFAALQAIVPGAGVGVAVAVNGAGSQAPTAIVLTVLDRLLDGPHRDWVAVVRADRDEARRRECARLDDATGHDQSGPPALPLAGYSGVYRHPHYGLADVRADDGRLAFTPRDFVKYRCVLEHRGGETFWMHILDPAEAASCPATPFGCFVLDGAAVASLVVPDLGAFSRVVPDP